jgi:hypothetical protein
VAVTTPRGHQQFISLPSAEAIQIAWPTPNHFLLDAPWKPGWTRDCGKRFHRGCDIAPVNVTGTGKTTRVIFTDCATNADFESEEPTFVPQDDVFCVFDGRVAEVLEDESASDFGRHIVIEHVWPSSGEKFFTLYAHLAEIGNGLIDLNGRRAGPARPTDDTARRAWPRSWNRGKLSRPTTTMVVRGQRIGKMGQTARSADARNWMAIAPHLHFEVRDAEGRAYEPVELLRRFVR